MKSAAQPSRLPAVAPSLADWVGRRLLIGDRAPLFGVVGAVAFAAALSAALLGAGTIAGAVCAGVFAAVSAASVSLCVRTMRSRISALQDAIDAVGDGFVLYDRDDRLVLTNRKYRELHAANPIAWRPGTSFEDLFRAAIACGEIPLNGRSVEEVVRERLALHRKSAGAIERPNGDGWLRISERSTVDGGTVSIHADITALKKAQTDAEAAHARMADFAAAAIDWFWEADADGNLTYVSTAFELATGIPTAKRRGAPRLDITRSLDPDNPGWDEHLRAVAAREPFRDFVMRVRFPHGVKHLSVSGKPLFDATGRFIGYRGTTRDVTKDVEGQLALARQSTMLSTLIQNLPVGVNLVGPDMRFMAFNRLFFEFFDLPSDLFNVGDSFETFVRYTAERSGCAPHEVEPQIRERLARAMEPRPHNFERVRPNGQVIEVRRVPLPGGGFVTTYIDVTSARRREADLEEARARLEQQAAELVATSRKLHAASSAKSLFLANMSHELRTPLNAILGFSEIMISATAGPLSSKYQEYAQDIHASGSYLLKLINDLLDTSKIEAGQLGLNEDSVDIPVLIDECRRLLAERANANNIELNICMPPHVPLVRADRLRLKQALLNLFSNAVKFSSSGGSVSISVSPTDVGGIAIVVADNGIGMNPAEIPVALEPFRQLDASLARRHEGTGLGLPLAKSLIELHGGTLAIDSTPGVGTTVRVVLPAARVTTPWLTAAQ